MALVLKDRVKETTTTTGTGSFALAGAVTGYDSFGQIGTGNTTYYAVYLDGGSEWEVGIGTYTAPSTLSRDTILASSNSGSVVTFSAGQKTIWCDYPAGKAAFQNASGVVNAPTFTASTAVKSPYFDATTSAGGALRNSGGTNQIQWGAGGGNNVSIDVSTNLNGANAQIDISPTGTGHVHIKPTGSGSLEIAPTSAGTINNMVIGGTTPLAITGTTITATSFVGSGASLTNVVNSLSAGTGISVSGSTGSVTVSNTGVTSVSGTAPIVSSGGSTPAISIPQATSSVNGYLSSTDWTTFNGKGNGTVTSVAALTLGTSGTDLSSTVANGTTTPVITLNVPTASATNRGALSSTDWTTFNNKAAPFTYTTNYVPYGQGTTTPNQSANFTYNGTTLTAQVMRASNGIVVNSKTVSANYTIATGDSAMSAGPITVNSGVSVTVSSGSRWVVL